MIEMLKNKIKEANEAYRAGNPIMNDGEYDALLDELMAVMGNPMEYEEFVSTLNEGAIERNADGKVKHPFVMGSLNKQKAENPEETKSWIKTHIKSGLSVSAKVDGISSRLEIVNGKIVSCSTRGDGSVGIDITNKVKYFKGIPNNIPESFNGNIRGELVILRSDFALIKDRFANCRNAVAGIVNRKELTNDLKLVSFIPYTILGNEYTKVEQFKALTNIGFKVADNFIIDVLDINDSICDFLTSKVGEYSDNLDYDTDGIVLSDISYRNEEIYRPSNQIAYKRNMSIATSTIIGFDWGTPSANGKMTPVALISPVEIAGVTVSRVTCNNITWMEKLGIEIGKTVKVMRSGEVIPKIVEVLD